MHAIDLTDDGFWTLFWVVVGLLAVVGAIVFTEVR
jgi:hypothetical protein